ncbi:MAG: ATP-dependent DNA helicase RecQ [Akkermansia sp.]|nr:ATP-dependent DNA helicase RecQ [Akkermansia sp.]
MELADQESKMLRVFGREAFRPGQQELLRAALAGRNCLGIMPTGHGKSLCYQMAAALLDGCTSLVVSPLIALMREQVAYLQGLGIAAWRYDSTLEDTERDALLAALAGGLVQLLYVAPESLENAALQQALVGVQLGVFVVDEAHCISEWGHSFRPDYLKLPRWCEQRSFHAIMAFTATATLRVRTDLCRAFHIEDADVVSISPYRPNITRQVQGAPDRMAALCAFLQDEAHLPAIVYARTRKGCEELATALQASGFDAAAYHAGQPAELREQLQDAFLANERRVLVATIAFGMGVDKPDVRSVVHFNAPSSPESYLQESGRAGRDGAPALSLVLLHGDDVQDARNRIFAAEPDAEGVLRASRWLLPAAPSVVSLWELGTSCDVPEDVPLRLLTHFQQAGFISVEGRGFKYYKVKPLFNMATILDGRGAEEVAQLRWLDAHREGEVADAADAWRCSFAEAMAFLRECEQAGEWKITFRQQALCLVPLGGGDARSAATMLSAAYARRRDADGERLQTLLNMLTGRVCINAALAHYFTGETPDACGHCAACCGGEVHVPPAQTKTLSLPPDAELPEFSRSAQRRRFLLGIASPGLMARRLWAHPHYACAAGSAWDEL